MEILKLSQTFLVFVGVVIGCCCLQVTAIPRQIHGDSIISSSTEMSLSVINLGNSGNSAANNSDTGANSDSEICSRDHNLCSEKMEPYTSLHSLRNSNAYPKMKCSCDTAFYQCLQNVNSFGSNRIGSTYFANRRQCYDEDFPVLRCHRSWTKRNQRRCMVYTLDTTMPKRWQFFDNPFYRIPGF